MFREDQIVSGRHPVHSNGQLAVDDYAEESTWDVALGLRFGEELVDGFSENAASCSKFVVGGDHFGSVGGGGGSGREFGYPLLSPRKIGACSIASSSFKLR